MKSSLILLAGAHLATAHFSIEYPEWRGDTLTNTNYSQYDYPCGGVSPDAGNRTDWPLTGGSVSLHLHHPWTYVFVNLGLGTNASNFNYSLTPSFVNVTGNGTYCFPVLPLPVEVADGTNASLQVVTSGASGSALYNCADITFRSNAQPLSGDACQNTTVSAVYISQVSASSANSTNTTSTGKNAASPGRGDVNIAALAGIVGLVASTLLGWF
ncbi:hypothetical protein BX600DRAFT_505499 [Xylariales sp. PMI_506]|nr:hypothetical protein BX600DRAFT_505499 [Xylariales sp. PMI_506]